MNRYRVSISLSIFYLYQISQYNICSFNNIHTSKDWFLHPSNGGVCIFGQVMAILTCMLLVILLLYPKKIILYGLAFLWVIIPYLMNNSWLSLMCIPLAITWVT